MSSVDVEVPNASVWRRVLSRTIDVMSALAAAAAVGALLSRIGTAQGVVGAVVAIVAAFTVFDAWFVAIGRQSPGRAAMGIMVVGVDGEVPGAAAGWLRFIAISPLLVGLPFALFGAWRRRTPYHDRIAATRVIPVQERLPNHPTEPATVIESPRWFVVDAVVTFLSGVWVTVVVASAVFAFAEATPTFQLVLIGPLQLSTTAITLVALSRRRGTGSLGDDFGLRLHRVDAKYVLAGVGLQFAIAPITVLLMNITHANGPSQAVVRDARDTGSPVAILVAALAAVIVAPILEETVFRGILLRSLLRRHSRRFAIGASGLAFGCAHLLDPGAWPVVPSLIVMGIVLGRLVADQPDNSKSMFTHAGANLIPALVILSRLFTK